MLPRTCDRQCCFQCGVIIRCLSNKPQKVDVASCIRRDRLKYNLILIINDFQTYDADVQYGGTNTGLSHYSLWGWGSNWMSPLLLEEFKYNITKAGYNSWLTSTAALIFSGKLWWNNLIVRTLSYLACYIAILQCLRQGQMHCFHRKKLTFKSIYILHRSSRKSKDYVYGIWLHKVLGIWKGYYRVQEQQP